MLKKNTKPCYNRSNMNAIYCSEISRTSYFSYIVSEISVQGVSMF